MNAPQLREQFAAELNRHRLPRAYIERLLAEWDDHIADLQEERSTAMAGTPDVLNFQERLGDPAQLAAAAATHYHNRSFLGRHPILTFLVLPYPIALVFLILIGLLLTGFGMTMNAWFGESPSTSELPPLVETICCMCIAWIFIVLPPICSAAMLCRIARRNALNWRWTMAACAIIALFAGQFRISWRLATLPQTGQLMIGLGFRPQSATWIFCDFLPRFAFALAIGWLLVKRAMRLQKLDENRREIAVLRQAA